MIAILDYQMGNLRSVSKAVERVGGKPKITQDPQVALKADRLIVPGVGAFRDCMKALKTLGLDEAIGEFIKSGKPYFGICLGMQVLMESSFEGGEHSGLGLIKGQVQRFDPKLNLKVPHMGWNQIKKQKDAGLFKDIPEASFVYFVHSYYVSPAKNNWLAATTEYGLEFCSAMEHENIWAVQFHPEKSQEVGLQIIKNFVDAS